MSASIDQEERRWQNQLGGSLQEHAYDRPGTREVHDRQFARIAEAAEIRDGMRILDVGCGVGHLIAWMAGRCRARLHGLDISIASLGAARRMLPEPGWVAGSAETLPYRDHAFDRIICNGSAHHIVDKQASFAEMKRIMRPGGRLILHEPASTPFTVAIRAVFVRSDKYESPVDLAHKEDFTTDAAEKLLREAGFVGFRRSQHDFLAYPLSGNYFKSPFSRSKRLMTFLLGLERALVKAPLLGRVFGFFSWRTLLVCETPAAATSNREGVVV